MVRWTKPLSCFPCLAAVLAAALISPAEGQEPHFFEPLQLVLDDAGGVQGLEQVWDLVSSPDGRDLYSVSPGDNALVHWRLGGGEGLEQVNIYRAGFNAPAELAGVLVLEISPDGRFLYAAARDDHLLVYHRDPATGALEIEDVMEVHFDTCTNAGYLGTLDLEISPAGDRLFAMGGRASGAEGTLVNFAVDPATGRLQTLFCESQAAGAPVGVRSQFDSGWGLAASADGRFLYLASFLGAVKVFAVDETSGQVTFLQSFEDLGPHFSSPVELALSPDERFLHALDASGDRGADRPGIWVFQRDPTTGLLTLASTCCELDDPQSASSSLWDLLISADGRDLYTAGFVGNSVVHFRRDATTGELSLQATYPADPQDDLELQGVSTLAFGPSEETLYAASYDRDALYRFRRNPSTGALSLQEQLQDSDGATIQGLHQTQGLVFSPDGRFLLAGSYVDDSVSVFEVDGNTGITRQVSQVTVPEANPRDVGPLRFSMAGDLLFAQHRFSALTIFRFLAGTGELEPLNRVEVFGTYDNWVVSPDSRHLYAWSEGGSVAIYSFDEQAGQAEFVDTQRIFDLLDGTSVVISFLGDLIISSDGRFLHGSSAEGLLLFERQPENGGRLRLLSVLPDEVEADVSPRRIFDLLLSPDERHLYGLFLGFEEDLILSFERNRENGELAYVGSFPILGPSEALDPWPRELTMSGDGLHLFLTTQSFRRGGFRSATGALEVYVRNPKTGRLSRLERHLNHRGGLNGFLVPEEVASSPDGNLLAVSIDAGLQLFNKAEIPCPAEEAGLCLGGERFAVEVDWRRPNGTEGTGAALDLRSDDSGLFWFFREDNLEMLVKVLDGCSRNDSHWVFSAATTNVEYDLKVADRVTGLRRTYTNELGVSAPALTDTGAFAACLDAPAAAVPAVVPASWAQESSVLSTRAALSGTCVPDDVTLCLNGGRFKVEVAWERSNGTTGVGHEVPFGSDDSGLLWFFQQPNWEMLVKVLDGCANNGHYWVFSAATTNVEYTLRVTDTVTGQIREYFNPLGNRAAAITDTFAFETCS